MTKSFVYNIILSLDILHVCPHFIKSIRGAVKWRVLVNSIKQMNTLHATSHVLIFIKHYTGLKLRLYFENASIFLIKI